MNVKTTVTKTFSFGPDDVKKLIADYVKKTYGVPATNEHVKIEVADSSGDAYSSWDFTPARLTGVVVKLEVEE